MKKLKPKTSLTASIIGLEDKQEPYEIIYADPKDAEIHLQILKKVQLNAQMARWSLDFEYNQLLWSDGVYGILEVDPRKSGASYDTFLKMVHPEDLPIKEAAQKALLTTKSPIEITYRLQMDDGRIKWVNEICDSDFDQAGNPVQYYGVIQDITKYKQSEGKFAQKEQSYLTLINSLSTGIATYQNRKFTFINPAGIRLLGANVANEIIGKPVLNFLHANSIKNFRKKMNELELGKSVESFDEKLIRLDGSVIDAEITPIKTIFNDAPAIQVIVKDVTEQKKTEQALKKSEEKFRLLAINLSDLKWAINSRGVVTYVSPFEENILGFTAEEIIKTRVSNFLTPTSVLSCLIELEEMMSYVQSGKKIDSRKLILEPIGNKGAQNWIEVTIIAIYNSANRIVGFSGICNDIAQKQKAEQILKENEILLQNELQLKELIATKDKFFSIIAHDLRSPFNSILGSLDILQTQYDDFSDDDIKEYINLIAENANITLNLLENLLVWAKSQTGRISYQPNKQKLVPIINSVKKTFNAALNLKGITLEILAPDDIEIFADTNMLMTVLQNLVGNAIKYSYQGGQIQIKAQQVQNQIELSVKDNGMGMNKETRDKIFKIGEHVSMPGTKNEKGSGLGLILCKDFVEMHNGSIDVESEPNKGSRFIIRIPQSE